MPVGRELAKLSIRSSVYVSGIAFEERRRHKHTATCDTITRAFRHGFMIGKDDSRDITRNVCERSARVERASSARIHELIDVDVREPMHTVRTSLNQRSLEEQRLSHK